MMATMDMGAQGVTEDEAETIDFIKERIWLDPLAVDLQLSLFIAAMNSYRHDTVLRPFPPMFQSEDKEKDIKTMVYRSLCVRKPAICVSDHVRHKPACTSTEDG